MLFSFGYDSRLPIVLFVGQHFSGSLFKSMHLSILTRERTKETRARELGAPSPYLLGSLPRAPSFLTHTPTPPGVLDKLE